MESAELKQHLSEVSVLAGMPVAEIVLPEDREVLVNGMRFHYLDWGTAGKPPVVFLHGGSLTAHTWDLVCLAMRGDYHCRAMDLRGHGDSDWAPDADYSMRAYSTDVEGLVEQLGLDRFILVGMSLGGGTALDYAGRNVERLAGLVLVDTGPDTRSAGRQRIADFTSGPREMDSVDAFVERALSFNPLRKPEMLRRSLLHNLRQTPTGTWTWKWDHRRNSGAVDERARRATLLWEAVPRVTCPTLVVRGGRSDVFYDEDAEKLAAALPDASWVRIEGAGHTVQGDQPRALVEALTPFFAKVWA